MTARRQGARRVIVRMLGGLAAALCPACGLEDYPFLKQAPPSGVSRSDNATASVFLPDGMKSSSGFLYFSVYYRIYISDNQITSTISESQMGTINSSLQSDYSYIKPYTQENNNLAANTGGLFSGRNFFELEIEGEKNGTEGINDELDIENTTITFSFADVNGQAPQMRIGNKVFVLRRSNGSGLFNPKPLSPTGAFDGRFINAPDLYSGDNATAQINRDVSNKSGIASGSPRYTYASLYVCAVGLNGTTLAPFYGAPTFIGTFLLPRQWETGDNNPFLGDWANINDSANTLSFTAAQVTVTGGAGVTSLAYTRNGYTAYVTAPGPGGDQYRFEINNNQLTFTDEGTGSTFTFRRK